MDAETGGSALIAATDDRPVTAPDTEERGTSTLSLVVPVYYNGGSIPELFERLLDVEKEVEARGMKLQMVFVDDGSGDDSFERLKDVKKARPATTVVKLTRNFGAIAAVKTALRHVRGDCFMFLAADLQDPPELILQMLDRWREGEKYVICTRSSRDDPWSSKLFASVYYRVLRSCVVPDYPDRGFDLALMDGAFLPYILDVGKHVNIPLFPYWLGFEPSRIEYERQARRHGKSRWTFFKKLKLATDSVLGLSFIPVRLMTLVGVGVALVSGGYGTLVLVSALLGYVEVPGFAALATLISFLLGLVIVMLGVIGEFVWRIFDEVNNHPTAVVDEVL